MRFAAYVALTFIIAALLIFFSKPIAILIVESISPSPDTKGTPVAQVAEVIGEVFVRRSQVTYTKPIEKVPLAIYHQDTLLIGTGSSARLIVAGGTEGVLLEDSEAIIEFFSAKDALSPVYLTIRQGDFEIKKAGVPGRFFIVKDKKVLSLAEWESHRSQPMKVVDLEKAEAQTKIESANPSPGPTWTMQTATEEKQLREENTGPVIKIAAGETLSSAYIEKTLALRSPQFRHCQANSVRDRLAAFGQLVFSIRIESNGKVSAAKPMSSTINNIHLHSCVADVIMRTSFHNFDGPAITLSYPIDFN
jgi:hypothetical protein